MVGLAAVVAAIHARGWVRQLPAPSLKLTTMKKIFILLTISFLILSCETTKEGCVTERNIQKFNRSKFRAQIIKKKSDSLYLVKTIVRSPKGFEVKKDLFNCCPDSLMLSKL